MNRPQTCMTFPYWKVGDNQQGLVGLGTTRERTAHQFNNIISGAVFYYAAPQVDVCYHLWRKASQQIHPT